MRSVMRSVVRMNIFEIVAARGPQGTQGISLWYTDCTGTDTDTYR